MGGAADADGGVIEFAGFLPRERNQLLDVSRRKRAPHEQNLITHRQHRHRREIALPVVGHALVQRCGDGQRAVGREVERIAVRLRMRRKLGPDQAASARPIVDHHLLSPDAGELVAKKTRQQVAAAPGRIGHDEADRPGGKILRRSSLDWRKRQGERDDQRDGQRTNTVGAHCSASLGENAFMRAPRPPCLPAPRCRSG